jgi:hypothetical protein
MTHCQRSELSSQVSDSLGHLCGIFQAAGPAELACDDTDSPSDHNVMESGLPRPTRRDADTQASDGSDSDGSCNRGAARFRLDSGLPGDECLSA